MPPGGQVMALFSTYQSTDLPLLSTLYEPPPKHLISVLGAVCLLSERPDAWAEHTSRFPGTQIIAYFVEEGVSRYAPYPNCSVRSCLLGATSRSAHHCQPGRGASWSLRPIRLGDI